MENPIAGPDEIRQLNLQRFEMEQLDAIVYADIETYSCAGYKDLTENEFWVRGHMPGSPLMPGVVMVEAAAQLSSYLTLRYDLLGGNMVGLGGLEEVRFRGPVYPGSRLLILCQMYKRRPRRLVSSRFQGIVDGKIVVDGVIKGVPLPVAASKFNG